MRIHFFYRQRITKYKKSSTVSFFF